MDQDIALGQLDGRVVSVADADDPRPPRWTRHGCRTRQKSTVSVLRKVKGRRKPSASGLAVRPLQHPKFVFPSHDEGE